MTLLNIKNENQWDEPNTRNKKPRTQEQWWPLFDALDKLCLLYTSDAADE
mgnify:CR=1 FL=1